MGARREVSSRQLPVSRNHLAKCCVVVLIALVLGGCREAEDGNVVRIGLLAPFEGRYREVGYNAYYAAKLALADHGKPDVELVAVDDGGTVESAMDRARALEGDPLMKAVIVLGYAATDAETQRAFADLPVLIAGHWGAKPETESVFLLASPELDVLITTPPRIDVVEAAKARTPIVGGEVFTLEQFPMLRTELDGITIATSASLPDAALQERYRSSSKFTPQPGILATLTYQAANAILFARAGDKTVDRNGLWLLLNDNLFKGGYLVSAPINYYAYDSEGKLVPVDRPVE